MNNNELSQTEFDVAVVVLVDYISLYIIAAGILLDIFWVKNATFEIASVSIDSFIALIGIVASFLIPYADNRTYRKYDLSDEDLKTIKGSPTVTYVNMFVVALLIFVADAIFYTVGYSITLIAIIIVGVLFLAVFIAPKIIEYIRGDDAVIEIVAKKCNEYVDDEKYSFDSWTKLAVSVMLDKGVDKTIKAFDNARCNKKKEKNGQLTHYENELIKFFVEELNKYIDAAIDDPNVDTLLKSSKIHEILDSSFYFCSRRAFNRYKNFPDEDEDKIYEIFHQISLLFQKIWGITVNTNFDIEFKSRMSSLISEILSQSIKRNEKYDETYFLFLCNLFALNLNENNFWFLGIFSKIWNTDDVWNFRFEQRSFLLLMAYQLIGYISRLSYQNSQREDRDRIKDIIKNCSFRIRRSAERIFDKGSYEFLYNLYLKCRANFKEISVRQLDHEKYSQEVINYNDFSNVFDLYVSHFVCYTLPLSHYENIETIDELLCVLGDKERDLLLSGSPSLSRRDVYSFVDSMNGLVDDKSPNLDYDQFLANIEYINNYEARLVKLNKIKKKILDSYILNFNTKAKEHPCYDEGMDISEKETIRKKSPFSLSVYVSKQITTRKLLSKDSPFNFTNLLNNIISHSALGTAHSFTEVKEYDDLLFEHIDALHPKYKHAPIFDKYCRANNLSINGCSNCDWLGYEPYTDVFAEEGAIKQKIELSESNLSIRNISHEEATRCYAFCKTNKKQASIIVNPNNRLSFKALRNLTDEDQTLIKKTQEDYYCLFIELDISKCVQCDEKKLHFIFVSSSIKDKK